LLLIKNRKFEGLSKEKIYPKESKKIEKFKKKYGVKK